MADGSGILIIGEISDDAPASATLEALAAGRTLLLSLGSEQMSVVLAGPSVDSAAQVAIAHGADTVYTIGDASFAEPQAEAMVAAAEEAVRQCSPRFVLGSKTILGRDLMPRLAYRLGTALAQDCTSSWRRRGEAVAGNAPGLRRQR